MQPITNEIASRNILSFLDEGRLVQNSWSTERGGKHMACLLGAAGGFKSSKECPAELMPRWLAESTVVLFDGLAPSDVPPISRRYAELIGQWSVITAKGWDDILVRWLVRLIDQAVESVPAYAKTQPYWAAVESACAQSTAALKSGDKAAADAARAAAYAAYAARAAAYAARAAAYAAYAAADAAYAARAAAYAKLFNTLLDEIEKEIALTLGRAA